MVQKKLHLLSVRNPMGLQTHLCKIDHAGQQPQSYKVMLTKHEVNREREEVWAFIARGKCGWRDSMRSVPLCSKWNFRRKVLLNLRSEADIPETCEGKPVKSKIVHTTNKKSPIPYTLIGKRDLRHHCHSPLPAVLGWLHPTDLAHTLKLEGMCGQVPLALIF